MNEDATKTAPANAPQKQAPANTEAKDKAAASTSANPGEAKLSKELKLPAPVLGLDVSTEGDRAWVACLDGQVFEVDLNTGERTALARHESYASSVHRVPGQDVIISGGYDGALLWIDRRERKVIRRVVAHQFWSWQSAVSPDGRFVASATGRYVCGGNKYEPAAETEPSVKVFTTATGELVRSYSHVPPVQCVAFTPDSGAVAAGNLMGEVRLWSLETGESIGTVTTPSYTGWGVIKGHYYTGGIYSLLFTPEGTELLVAGMGSTIDPAAGNGKQLWQRFAWQEKPVRKVAEARDEDIGRGLMETLAFHPDGRHFVMAGRLFNGKWNTAFFDRATGVLQSAFDAKMRVTKAMYRDEGRRLILGGTVDQGRRKDGKPPESGRIKIYELA